MGERYTQIFLFIYSKKHLGTLAFERLVLPVTPKQMRILLDLFTLTLSFNLTCVRTLSVLTKC